MEKLNIFEAVKQSVPIRQAASFYGIRINKNGKALCPLHDDHEPSLQFYDDHFYCFGCGAAGDVIALTAKLFHLEPLQAARQLAMDFDVAFSKDVPFHSGCLNTKQAGSSKPPIVAEEEFRKERTLTYFTYCDYQDWLKQLFTTWEPKPGDEADDRFLFCCQELSRIEQYLDILQPGSSYPKEDMAALLKDKEKEVGTIHEILNSCHN